ncbi:MBL fold metallo-hydrolase [Natroniella sulfidigena]|uniref:MBL fold metallo-hydrolase n=1 Tax=Natroniella sulfidigena TaxID=723921 RepID=UPI00200B82F5|nr:MBL fold metallo-hydrolase [Natroniella sulfidigena]MCK8816956.1 MBL fold metallo-hydrolase [Natroniella sulfidigena]
MKFEIIGSGGCVALPKPLCNCKVCQEAREKGRPYSRYGCSLFLHDINLLIDTPEDIVHAINDSSIQNIDAVMFSHLDPDHTLGFRVFEDLRLSWLKVSEGKECNNPIDVIAMPHVMEDLNAIQSSYGSFLDYYENAQNLIKRHKISDYQKIEEIKISFIRVERTTIFVFEAEDKKLIYAPCDVKPFPDEEIFVGADVMIIGNTIIGEELKDGYKLSEDNFLREELFSMSEVLSLKEKFEIKRVIVTHIEEAWGKSYDDYVNLEEQYDGVQFAYDGMEILI